MHKKMFTKCQKRRSVGLQHVPGTGATECKGRSDPPASFSRQCSATRAWVCLIGCRPTIGTTGASFSADRSASDAMNFMSFALSEGRQLCADLHFHPRTFGLHLRESYICSSRRLEALAVFALISAFALLVVNGGTDGQRALHRARLLRDTPAAQTSRTRHGRSVCTSLPFTRR
jgi:hypothetical protein